MRKLVAGAAAAAAAAALTVAPASPVAAQSIPTPVGFANVTIDGLLPICLNIIDVNILGIQLLDIPTTCILD